MNEIVTELVIDSGPAVAGVDAYIISMDLAADATEKMVAQTQKVDDAISKQIGPVTQSTERLGTYRSAYERLVTSVDPAARAHAAYERAVKTSENAVRRGIATNEEAADTLDQLQRKLLGISDTPVPDPIPPSLPGSAAMSTQQLANLQFQLQDVGQAMLTGQPAFTTFIQQGSQIVQTMDGSAGVTAALKKVGAGLLSYITNPLNLAVLGFAVFAGAAQSLMRGLGGSADAADKAEAANDRLADTIGTLRDVYGEARVEVEELTAAEATRLALQTQIDLNAARADLTRRTGDLTRVTNVQGDLGLNMILPDPGQGPQRLAIDEAVQQFLQTVTDGEPNVVAFREAMEAIALASEEQRVDDFTRAVLDQITPVADLEARTNELAAAMVLLTDAQGPAAESAREVLGLATRLDAAMETLAESTRDAGRANGAGAAAAARSAVEMLQLRRALDLVTEGLTTAVRAARAGIAEALGAVDFAALPAEALIQLNAAWSTFDESLRAGQPDVIAFREAIATIANLDPENAALQTFADTLIRLTTEAAGLQELVDGAAPIKTLADAAVTAKPPIDGTTRALQQLKDAAEGGIDQAMAKSLYQVALAAAETKEEIIALQRAWAALPFNVGTAPIDIGTANVIKEKTERERLAEAAGDAAETASAFDQATEAIERQIRALEIDAATFGMTADAAALFRLEMQLLDAALEDGIVSDAERAAMAELLGQFQAAQAALADLNATAADGAAWQAAKGYAESFATSLVSGLMQGKTALEAIEGSLRSFSQTMMQSAVKDLFAGNFGAGIVKGVVGLIAGLIARRIAERRELAEAQAAWRDMSDELADFAARLAGGGSGTLSSAIADATAEMQPFIDAAKKAKESTADLNRMLADYARRISTEFMGRFGMMVDAFEAGLGSNSPAVTAAQNVAAIGEELRGFVDDTKVATATLRGNRSAVREAEDAAQAYALSLLRTPPALSEVETEMLRIEGTAAALADVLVSLGMSSAEAAAAISDGVDAALGDLRQKFTTDLRAKINEALGRGYINEVTDLVGEAAQLLEDAAALGLSGTDVSAYFAAQAQAIVDGADLTGEAFAELIALFPQLAGVVTEASGSVEEAMERINDAAAGVLDYVRGLLTGSSSTLSPEARLANARAAYDAQIALAQSGDVGAQAGITDFADALLDAARTMFASSAGYQDIFTQVTSQLLGLPAVQQTTDPANVALRQSLGGMGGGPSALSISPSASVALGVSTPASLTPTAANDPGGWRQSFADLMQVTAGIGNAQIVDRREGTDRIVQRLEAIERTLSVQRDQPRRAGGRRGRP